MIDVDVIGTLYTVGTFDENGNFLVHPTPMAGWHVNTTFPVIEWEAYKIEITTPRRIFGGHETLFYCFPDQETYELLLETTNLEAF